MEGRFVPAVTLRGETRGIKGTNTGGQVWSGTLGALRCVAVIKV